MMLQYYLKPRSLILENFITYYYNVSMDIYKTMHLFISWNRCQWLFVVLQLKYLYYLVLLIS